MTKINHKEILIRNIIKKKLQKIDIKMLSI